MQKNNSKNLIDRIINFGFEYQIFDKTSDKCELKYMIYSQLKEEAFVESLIIIINKRIRQCRNIDVEEVKYLLIELETIRLELELKNYVS